MPDLFVGVTLIECADKAALEELLGAGLARYVVRRLSDTTVVVDHECSDDVLTLLRRQVQTPKITRE